eukprot:CAMPEP_0201241858 /NCGR_PEP_ID=MMETSP0852-20130820/35510_1 /ASSEMBLY_ACC=CAM_ASM_000632 /TAXON_ID=183588 /ORGANISM="Pseudo-nitzschia fraudulenta, Strain WWA7" /LENGTH=42 /DNA_ID= /DNA_START= /DNA_END= /DNA_ORIENTATION=
MWPFLANEEPRVSMITDGLDGNDAPGPLMSETTTPSPLLEST